MFTAWDLAGFTAMKRSAFAQPASRRILMEEGSPRTVTTSAVALSRWSRASLSSMTVMSPPSWLSIFARWDPTWPAPSMMIFIRLSLLSDTKIRRFLDKLERTWIFL